MNKLLLLLIVLVMPACTVYTMPGPSYAAGSSFSYGYSVEAYPTPARYSYGYSPEYVPSTTPRGYYPAIPAQQVGRPSPSQTVSQPAPWAEQEGQGRGGPPAWAGRPSWAGRPDGVGRPEWAGRPSWAGPPARETPPGLGRAPGNPWGGPQGRPAFAMAQAPRGRGRR